MTCSPSEDLINLGICPVFAVCSKGSFRPTACTTESLLGAKVILLVLSYGSPLIFRYCCIDHLPCFMVSDLGLPKSDRMTGLNGLKFMLNLRLLSCVFGLFELKSLFGPKIDHFLKYKSFYIQFSFKGFLFKSIFRSTSQENLLLNPNSSCQLMPRTSTLSTG